MSLTVVRKLFLFHLAASKSIIYFTSKLKKIDFVSFSFVISRYRFLLLEENCDEGCTTIRLYLVLDKRGLTNPYRFSFTAICPHK